ncbi:linear amide C-N hydrolase [Flavobacterium filum]|uniref:linear amide C-N hydrolase n=1 Tax=Flavobacterium filum TaxID=370974 RepID=UPI0023F53A9D|nr:linear amide C-N hydrolase [Flavobacterium filum]
MKNKILLLIIGITLTFNSSIVFPCTSFVLKNNNSLLLGHNLDWHIGIGLLMTNKRNVEKTALMDSLENPAKWISKYGSITFNQVGRDLPYGGMNETGLVIEQMTLPGTQYPSKDNRKSISACQWIQYQLDNCSTIQEVISTDKVIRIVDRNSKFHFLICDKFGNAAVIEFLNGIMIVKKGDELPVTVLANSPYNESVSCFKEKANTTYNRSLYNFCTAASMIDNNSNNDVKDDILYSFNILESVAQGHFTKWSIVYDIKNLKVYFKVFESPTLTETQITYLKEEGFAKTKIVDLNKIDYTCSSPCLVMDLELDQEGLVNSYFKEYTTNTNKEYISMAFDYFWRLGIPIKASDEELNYLAKYPESFQCIDNK